MTSQKPAPAPHYLPDGAAPQEAGPQVYETFPDRLNQAFIDFVRTESGRGRIVLQAPSPKGGTAWLVPGLNEDKDVIVLQAPPTGVHGEQYLPTIAKYDLASGERIIDVPEQPSQPDEAEQVVEKTARDATQAIE